MAKLFHELKHSFLIGKLLWLFLLFSPAFGVIPADTYILEGGPFPTLKLVAELIQQAPKYSLCGAIKIYPDIAQSFELEKSLRDNSHWVIGRETRHSTAEFEKAREMTQASQKESDRSLIRPLDEYGDIQDRMFAFTNCETAHPKFFLTWDEGAPILLLGTTNLDDYPRDLKGKLLPTWYGPPENVVDFLAVIRDPTVIHEFISGLVPFLPPEISERLTLAYKSSPSPGKGGGETHFIWSSEDHKARILDLIDGARSQIKIFQQDLTDVDVQAALKNAAQRGVTIQIIMSETPFSRVKKNAAIPFMKELYALNPKCISYLTGCTDHPDLPPFHIHAKVLIADEMAYIGSANFYTPVLDPAGKHFNVGLVTTDQHYIAPLLRKFEAVLESSGSIPINRYKGS